MCSISSLKTGKRVKLVFQLETQNGVMSMLITVHFDNFVLNIFCIFFPPLKWGVDLKMLFELEI